MKIIESIKETINVNYGN